MATRPTRTRTRPTTSDASPAGRKTLFHRGDEGRQRIDSELELQKQKQAQSRKPFRFRVAVGATAEIIVVDEKPDFFLYEHNMKNPRTGKWGMIMPCLKEVDNCPLCEKVGESYYAMYLTVIDLTPFETRSGETVEFSRKLLVVKPSQQKKFIRRYEKEGTLRGALFECSRDKDKESAIGNDIEFIEMVPEDELRQYTRSWKDQEGKKHTENCFEPFVYEELIEVPTIEALRALVGAEPPPGSKEQVARDIGGDDGWDDDDAEGTPWTDDEEEKPSTPAKSARRRAADDDDDDDDKKAPDKTEEAEEAEEPARRRTTTAALRRRAR
jgi:hypothetical protein